MTDAWIMLVRTDDWDALYLNGRLAYENHSIPTMTLLALLEGKTILDVGSVYFKEEDVEEIGWRFPQTLAELKKTNAWKRNFEEK